MNSNPVNLSEWKPARRRRLLLAAYIDFLLFSTPWALLIVAVEQVIPQIANLSSVIKWLIFGALELVLLRSYAWSPGAALLGIRFVSLREHTAPIDQLWQGRVPYVACHVKRRESWYTLLLATWMMNEGCKSLVRWTLWNPPIPFFGQPTDGLTSALIYMVAGLLEILIAVQLFRVSLWAAVVGIPYCASQLASAFLSWGLWDSWVAEMVVRRREYQGLPVRDGEIEFMQLLTPEFLVAVLAAAVVVFVVIIPRLAANSLLTARYRQHKCDPTHNE